MTNFALSFAIYGMLCVQGLRSEPEEFDRGIAMQAYGYSSMTMVVGILLGVAGWFTTVHPHKRLLWLFFSSLSFFSLIVYVAMMNGFSSAVMSVETGYPIEPMRYLEWGHCSLPWTVMVAQLTQTEEDLLVPVLAGYAVIFCGFIGALLPLKTATIFLGTAFSIFMVFMRRTQAWFQHAFANEQLAYLARRKLRLIYRLTIGGWSAYPIAFYLTLFHLVSYETGEVLYTLADIGGKMFFTLVLINSSMEQTTNFHMKRMMQRGRDMSERMSEADRALSEVLPRSIMRQLLQGLSAEPREYDRVTIISVGICDYEHLAQRMTGPELMESLASLWLALDAAARAFRVEKVEATGNKYLAVAGAPDRSDDHPEQVVGFALEVIKLVYDFRTITGETLQVRLGVHTGSAVAGVFHVPQPRWSVIGDSVKLALKLQAGAPPMKVRVSESTRQAILRDYLLDGADPIDVPGIGIVPSFIVLGRRSRSF